MEKIYLNASLEMYLMTIITKKSEPFLITTSHFQMCPCCTPAMSLQPWLWLCHLFLSTLFYRMQNWKVILKCYCCMVLSVQLVINKKYKVLLKHAGVVFASISSGFGEITLLSYSAHFDKWVTSSCHDTNIIDLLCTIM